jgi:RHH-type proline utilization regulon transcriptional repressor/proline dehydrogenase/delta 1-pyrroline-5-carboxylate dehydrogenase
VLAIAKSEAGLCLEIAAALAGGNDVVVGGDATGLVGRLPANLRRRVVTAGVPIAAVLVEGDRAAALAVSQRVAAWNGPIVPVQAATIDQLLTGRATFAPELLVDEVSVSINTAAAGGNASLMSLS